MYYADSIGAERILAKMEELGAEDRSYSPSELLREMAATGGKFTEIETGGLKVAVS